MKKKNHQTILGKRPLKPEEVAEYFGKPGTNRFAATKSVQRDSGQSFLIADSDPAGFECLVCRIVEDAVTELPQGDTRHALEKWLDSGCCTLENLSECFQQIDLASIDSPDAKHAIDLLFRVGEVCGRVVDRRAVKFPDPDGGFEARNRLAGAALALGRLHERFLWLTHDSRAAAGIKSSMGAALGQKISIPGRKAGKMYITEEARAVMLEENQRLQVDRGLTHSAACELIADRFGFSAQYLRQSILPNLRPRRK